MNRRFLSSLLGVGVACLLGAGAALPETVLSAEPKKPFSYFANGHELRTVLTGFAKTQGLSVAFDGNAVKGRVSGRFQRVAPNDFLSAMSEAYGVGHYVLGDTIHFYSASDVRKEFLTVPSGSAKALVDSLKRSGFVAAELPVSVNAEGNMLTLKGPEVYLTSIRAAADAYLAVQSEKIEMRVFPIRHAWADDIELSSMDRTVTVPGIASILRGMVLGQSVGGTTVSGGSNGPARAESVPSLGAEGLSRQKKRDAQPGPVNATPVAQGAVSIIADPRVNAVLVSDFAYRMPYYEEVIKSLDKPVELVEIHAAIVDIDTNASRELGVNFRGKGGGNWQGGGSLGSENTPVGGDTPGISTDLSSGGALLSTIYTHGSDYFMASINALESENAARMLGRPSVLTVDNVEAVLENTTTYYIPLRGQEAVDLYRVEAGTVLRVTPHIIHEGGKTSIKLAVSVQDDQNDASSGYQTVGESGDTLTVNPIKQTRINTQAMVEAGQSLLIGGYYYEQKSEGDSGVPILKDIPILGHLFKSSSTSGRQMERLILITPRIVTADGDNVPARVNQPGFGRNATGADYEWKALPQADASADKADGEG